MSNRLDLNIIPVCRRAGQDFPDLPGLYAARPPRRPVRSRSEDRLMLMMSLTGNASLLTVPVQQILDDLAKTYYKTSGSVTSALRSVAVRLNQLLLEVNLQNPGAGQPVLALLSQLVIRDDQLYLAQSGPVHAYLVTRGQAEHIYTPDLQGRGLGLAEAAPVRFYHHTLGNNDTVLVSDQHYATWEKEVLAGLYGESPGRMHQRVLSRSVRDMRAVLLQTTTGSGAVNLLKLKVEPDKAPAPGGADPPSQPAVSEAQPAGQETGGTTARQGAAGAVMAAGAVKSSSPAAGAPAAGTAARAAGGSTAQKLPQQVTQTAQPDPAPQTGDTQPQAAGSARRSPGDFFKQLLRPLVLLIQAPAALLERVLPQDTSEAMPNRTMAFVALIVPVVVVSVAVLVYIRRGVESQSQVVLDEAVELALKAQSETDILAKRSAWIDLVDYLDAAELLYAFPESQELRDLAQGSLDDIDLVRRIEYQPAVYGGLPSSVNVVRMVTVDDDLYMLDGNSGNVYHAALTEQGYVLDGTFLCGPGTLGVENRLIDIMAWPVGFEPMASLVAIDAQGNVVYCQPGQEPLISEFASPPTSSLSGLTGFTMDQSNLFLLDPQANSVWIYWGSETDSPPDPFFADQIPRLDDVVDLMIANNELYLLHQDGQLTICEYSSLEIAPTSCKEPVPFVDSRQARENMIITPTSPFSQILYNPPPDPSLFVLQPDSRSINLFSLRTPTYQTQYQPIAQLEGNEATAFAVDPIDRLMYLALGNHVYYGRIP